MDFPKPLIIEPLRLPHQQTFILLHGRGSSGHKFGPVLLETLIAPPGPLPPTDTSNHQVINRNTAASSLETNNDSTSPFTSNLTLATAFPNARFVFPTAARRRATIYKRAYTHQWFDNWKLDPPATYRENLQIDGLRETVAYLHEVLREEINLVPGGAENVVFGGLSQGCAAALVSLLLWEGDKLGAAVGMCGWLPFADRILEQINANTGDFAADAEDQMDEAEDDFDPFDRDDDDYGSARGVAFGTTAAAVSWLRDELQLNKVTLSDKTPIFQEIPIFLGHGIEDDRVSIILGRKASQCLAELKGRVCWNEYRGLGHWYSGDMLRSLVDFIYKEIAHVSGLS